MAPKITSPAHAESGPPRKRPKRVQPMPPGLVIPTARKVNPDGTTIEVIHGHISEADARKALQSPTSAKMTCIHAYARWAIKPSTIALQDHPAHGAFPVSLIATLSATKARVSAPDDMVPFVHVLKSVAGIRQNYPETMLDGVVGDAARTVCEAFVTECRKGIVKADIRPDAPDSDPA